MTARLTALLVGWVALVQRRARLVIAIDVALTIVFAVLAALFLGVNMDNKAVIANHLPFVKDTAAFEEHFPSLEYAILVVIDAETPELARDAATSLQEHLRQQTKLFSAVYSPASGPFFERHGLLYRSPDELDDLVDQLARMQPIITDLTRDGSIANLARIVRLGLEQQRDAPIDAKQWAAVLDRVGEATVRVYDEYPVSVSWEDLMLAGSAVDPRTRQLLIAEPVLTFDTLLPADRAIAAIRTATHELALLPEHGVQVRITGNPALNHEEMIGIAWDVGVAGVFSFALVTGILFLAFRALRLVSSAALTLLVGLIWTAGFATVIVGHLNIVSISFGVLFIGLGVDFAIHLGMHYTEEVQRGADSAEAFRRSIEGIGTALLLCALTTALGFFSFIPTDYWGVAELGLIAGSGMFIIVFQTVTLFPALVAVRLGDNPARWVHAPVSIALTPPALVQRHPGAVAAVALALGAGGLWLAPGARVDANVIVMRDMRTESVQAFNDLLANSRTSPWHANVLTADVATADALATRMRALPEVSHTLTISSYVPDDQDEKLEILADAAMLFDAPPAPTRPTEPLPIKQQIEALRELRTVLESPWLENSTGPLAASASKLRAEFDRFLPTLDPTNDRATRDAADDPATALRNLDRVLLGNFPAQVERLERALAPDPITRDGLPPEVRSRMLSADGHARVQIFPSANLRDTNAFTTFVDAVRSVNPHAIGVAVNLVEFARATERSLKKAVAIALIAITLLLLALWRRVDDTLLALAPLLLAGLLTVGAMVVLDLPFNFANVTALPLLLGIGIDSGIHLVHQSRTKGAGDGDLLVTTTARAVFFSAATTIASFGSLGFSNHKGIASLGILLVIGTLMMLGANLVVLPALLALRDRLHARRRGA